MIVKSLLIAALFVTSASGAYAAEGAAKLKQEKVQVALAGQALPGQVTSRNDAFAAEDEELPPGGAALLFAGLACIGFIAVRRAAGSR